MLRHKYGFCGMFVVKSHKVKTYEHTIKLTPKQYNGRKHKVQS